MQAITQALKDYEIVLNEMIQRFLQLEKSIYKEKQADISNQSSYAGKLDQVKNSLSQLQQLLNKNKCEEKLEQLTLKEQQILVKLDTIQELITVQGPVKKSRFIDFNKTAIAAIFLLCLCTLVVLFTRFKDPEGLGKEKHPTLTPEAIKYAFLKSLPQSSLKKTLTTIDTLYVKEGPAVMQQETLKNLKKYRAF